MKIGLQKKSKAYLPESIAYKKFLELHGHSVYFIDEVNNNIDIIIYFMGYNQFKSKSNNSIIEIHEYSSLSTPPFAKFKNYLKSKTNTIPDGRIFLNDVVSKEFNFKSATPFIFRDMGVDEVFFNRNVNLIKVFDIVYSGSERSGLFESIIFLLKYGFKIVLIGVFSKKFHNYFKSKVIFTGKLTTIDVAKVYHLSQHGLNITPDVYPYNIQTSTKVLEYSAAGLSIISNRYLWVVQFEKKYNARFFWIENLDKLETIKNFDFITPNVTELNWVNILNKANFLNFIESFK